MMLYAIGSAATGAVLLSRLYCWLSRLLGAVLVMFAIALIAAPAFADQTLLSSDGAQIDCTVSAHDLTRISLVDDGFASIQKIAGGSPTDDFTVVNEPLRGDIYLSIPDGFGRPTISFFATTKRGYVYKFVCRIAGAEAAQIFVGNPAIARAAASDGPTPRTRPTLQDAAVGLVQAMFSGSVADGYEMRQRALVPVAVGTLKVQLIAEYRGAELTGRVLRIENRGTAEVLLGDAAIAPAGAVAVSIAEPRLGPGRVTTAYVVTKGSS